MSKLILEIATKPKAKFLVRRLHSFICGEPFEVFICVKNIGKNTIRNGKIDLSIEWPNDLIEYRTAKFYELRPEQEKNRFSDFDTTAYTKGPGVFRIIKATDSTPKAIRLFDKSKNPLDKRNPVHSVYAQERGDFQSYWYSVISIIFSTISLMIIAAEKLWPLLIWLWQSFPKAA